MFNRNMANARKKLSVWGLLRRVTPDSVIECLQPWIDFSDPSPANRCARVCLPKAIAWVIASRPIPASGVEGRLTRAPGFWECEAAVSLHVHVVSDAHAIAISMQELPFFGGCYVWK